MAVAAAGAFFHTPGPKELWVKFRSSLLGGSGTDWQFLGTCVTAPDISLFPKHIDVYNDYGGRSVPTQIIQDGSESRVACTINYVDLNVVRNVRDAVERSGQPNRVGKETGVDRGSLVIGVSDFELAFKNVYYGTIQGTPGLPPGRYYYSAILEGYEEHTTGTRVEDVSMLFRCNNYPVGSSGFIQYTEDPAEFPTLVRS
jgi:hypothetical protein